MLQKIRKLEYIGIRAWASLENEQYDGWLLRASEGYTGRANSVQPLESSSLPVDEKINYCEAWYRQRDLPAIFRLHPAMQPPHLDELLHERGYTRSRETITKLADLTSPDLASDSGFTFETTLTDDWIYQWGTWNTVPQNHIRTAKKMLTQLQGRACFGRVGDVAVGLAVIENQHVGLFDIVVAPEQRRQGYGAILIAGLLGWAKIQGATTAYLQVLADNTAAHALYNRSGFNEHHRYWYRTQAF